MSLERRYAISLSFEVSGDTEPLDAIKTVVDSLRPTNARLTMMHFGEVVHGEAVISPLPEAGQVFDIPPQGQTGSSLEELRRQLTAPDRISNAPIYTTENLLGFFPGLAKENLYYWERRGYIHPERVQAGKRSLRRFNLAEATRAGLMWDFVQQGFSLGPSAERANQAIEALLQQARS